MAQHILSRLLMLVAVLFVVFVSMALLPGNGMRALLGRDASEADIAAQLKNLGLDRPVTQRFTEWITGLVHGDFGRTLRGESVGALLSARLPNTLALALPTLALTLIVTILLAAWWTSGDRPTVGKVAAAGTIVVIALPEFVLATLLILVFALTLDVLPAITLQDAAGAPRDATMYLLPILALSVPQIGWNTRVLAAAIREARTLPYIHAAELEGAGETTIFLRYTLWRALPTLVASLATTVGMIVGGTVVVESLFNFPGVGALVAASVSSRDVNVVSAVVACTGLVIVLMLVLADGTKAWTRTHAP